jgi:multisubunit Na+/H+ antiporter MnhB subunit
MRRVFFAGVALAVAFVVANLAFRLLNQPNDWAVAAGYLLLLALVSVLSGLLYRIWRRL